MDRTALAAGVGLDELDGFAIFDGCYDAHRAAALAGVPRSTVYDWARGGIVVPSISESRVKLWSYADLMALRITYWLRKPKGDVRATSMSQVRRALAQLHEMDRGLWEAGGLESPIVVDRRGMIHKRHVDGGVADLGGQGALDEHLFDPVEPFGDAGFRGPGLLCPRDHLRIVPGKVSGEPHLVGSRLTSLTVAALARRGFPVGQIIEMYPHENPVGVREAIELEQEIAPAAA